MSAEVPHPGPRPELFEFPFAQATEAVAAIDDLCDDLERLAQRHEDAAAVATVGFQGRTADEFAHLLGATLEAVRDDLRTLRAHAELLEQDTAVARQRREASVEARRWWEQRHRVWQAQQHAS